MHFVRVINLSAPYVSPELQSKESDSSSEGIQAVTTVTNVCVLTLWIARRHHDLLTTTTGF